MKMAILKYKLFIMFLTTYYIFDSVFADKKDLLLELSLGAVDPLTDLGFNGNLKHDSAFEVNATDKSSQTLVTSYKAFLKNVIEGNGFLWFYAITENNKLSEEFNKSKSKKK